MHEGFRPLHLVEEGFPKENKKDKYKEKEEEKQDHLRQLDSLKDTVVSLERELLECRRKCQELASLNSKLAEEKRFLENQKETLEKDLAELKALRRSVENLCQAILDKFSEIKDKVKEEIKDTALNIAKKLYLTEKLPKEELIVLSLQRALNSNLSLSGYLRLRLNPKDLPTVEEFIKTLDLKDIQLELIKDPNLSIGEFSIETTDFWIERKLEDILKDIEEEL